MDGPSDHLLRTFASVPYGNRVLDLNCGEGQHTVPLAQLGFDVYACDPAETAVAIARRRVAEVVGEEEAMRRVTQAYPDALGYPDTYFDWIVAYDAFEHLHARAALVDTLAEARRVLKDGGWIYLTVPAVPDGVQPASTPTGYAGDSGLTLRFTPRTLGEILDEAGFAEAQEPRAFEQDARPYLQAIYRRVDATTPK